MKKILSETKVKQRLNLKKGFTLIEVLVATTVATIIITALTALFINSIILNAEAKDKQIALKIAQNRIEELRNMRYGDLFVLPGNQNSTVSELKNGQLNTEITNSYSDPDIRKVKTEVSWTSRQGQTKTISLVTLIAKYGLINE